MFVSYTGDSLYQVYCTVRVYEKDTNEIFKYVDIPKTIVETVSCIFTRNHINRKVDRMMTWP